MAHPPSSDRPLKRALWRGWRRKCPACGTGHMLQGYLTVKDHCASCEEPLHHQRADDGPPWLTIMIVGHVVGPGMLYVFTVWQPDPLVMALGFCTLAVVLSLYLLPRLKGVFVAIQWANRMHGFGDT